MNKAEFESKLEERLRRLGLELAYVEDNIRLLEEIHDFARRAPFLTAAFEPYWIKMIGALQDSIMVRIGRMLDHQKQALSISSVLMFIKTHQRFCSLSENQVASLNEDVASFTLESPKKTAGRDEIEDPKAESGQKTKVTLKKLKKWRDKCVAHSEMNVTRDHVLRGAFCWDSDIVALLSHARSVLERYYQIVQKDCLPAQNFDSSASFRELTMLIKDNPRCGAMEADEEQR